MPWYGKDEDDGGWVMEYEVFDHAWQADVSTIQGPCKKYHLSNLMEVEIQCFHHFAFRSCCVSANVSNSVQARLRNLYDDCLWQGG